jgi:glucose-1-phosphate cytidylyltransferase
MIDTGLNTMTGGRIKRIQPYIGNERFCLTYGDGVTDLNIAETIKEHEKSGAILSLTAYRPTGKFGALVINQDTDFVTSFHEKPDRAESWINAGYFVCEPSVFDFIPEGDDSSVFEKEPLEKIAATGKMHAYKHYGFWKPMDMLKDNKDLNNMWNQGNAPWKVW